MSKSTAKCGYLLVPFSRGINSSILGKPGDARVCAIGGARLNKCCSHPSASISMGAEPTGPQDAGGEFSGNFPMGMSGLNREIGGDRD